jgi:hypothetical protein
LLCPNGHSLLKKFQKYGRIKQMESRLVISRDSRKIENISWQIETSGADPAIEFWLSGWIKKSLPFGNSHNDGLLQLSLAIKGSKGMLYPKFNEYFLEKNILEGYAISLDQLVSVLPLNIEGVILNTILDILTEKAFLEVTAGNNTYNFRLVIKAKEKVFESNTSVESHEFKQLFVDM